jgi:hypothetical protein
MENLEQQWLHPKKRRFYRASMQVDLLCDLTVWCAWGGSLDTYKMVGLLSSASRGRKEKKCLACSYITNIITS